MWWIIGFLLYQIIGWVCAVYLLGAPKSGKWQYAYFKEQLLMDGLLGLIFWEVAALVWFPVVGVFFLLGVQFIYKKNLTSYAKEEE